MDKQKKFAYWQELRGIMEGFSGCSECKDGIIKTEWKSDWNYCHKCGAKMSICREDILPEYE